MKERGSGILLHLTSLPSPFGIGDMGPAAYRFADFLHKSKQHYWQILPLSPTNQAHGNSPYHSMSAFAGNPLLISPEFLARDGLISQTTLSSLPDFPADRVDYAAVEASRKRLFDELRDRFEAGKPGTDFESFCVQHAGWLDDFSFFVALKSHFSEKAWTEWPVELRDRQPEALLDAAYELRKPAEEARFLQFLFFKQWHALKRYCNERCIEIIGDIPIYVVHDSVDVWTHPEQFKLDLQKDR